AVRSRICFLSAVHCRAACAVVQCKFTAARGAAKCRSRTDATALDGDAVRVVVNGQDGGCVAKSLAAERCQSWICQRVVEDVCAEAVGVRGSGGRKQAEEGERGNFLNHQSVSPLG